MRRFSKPERLRFRGKLSETFYSRVYDTATGKRKYRTTGRTSLKAALEQVKAWQMEDAAGTFGRPAAEERGFEGAIREWLDLKSATLSAGGLQAYRSYSAGFLAFFPSRATVRGITESSVEGYFRTRGPLVAPSTANKHRKMLKQFFKWTIARGWRTDDPTRTAPAFTEEKREITALDDEETAALLRACREPYTSEAIGKRNKGGRVGGKTTTEPTRWSQPRTPPAWLYPLVFFAVRTGMRFGSLAKLTWNDVDLRKKLIRSRAADMKAREELSIPIDGETTAFLAELRRSASGVKVLDLPDHRACLRAFKGAVKRAGLRPMRLHDLRATFISRCRRMGVDLEVTARLVGHRHVSTTLRFYRKVQERELRQAIEKLGGAPPATAGPALTSEPTAG